MEGAETHEMDILEPHSTASSLRSAHIAQDINEAQVEGVTSICHYCLILRRLFCSVTGSVENDVPEMNGSDDSSWTTSDRPTRSEGAYFLTISETSLA